MCFAIQKTFNLKKRKRKTFHKLNRFKSLKHLLRLTQNIFFGRTLGIQNYQRDLEEFLA